MEKLARRAFGQGAKFMSYTVVIKAEGRQQGAHALPGPALIVYDENLNTLGHG
jgi:hypothetical protein